MLMIASCVNVAKAHDGCSLAVHDGRFWSLNWHRCARLSNSQGGLWSWDWSSLHAPYRPGKTAIHTASCRDPQSVSKARHASLICLSCASWQHNGWDQAAPNYANPWLLNVILPAVYSNIVFVQPGGKHVAQTSRLMGTAIKPCNINLCWEPATVHVRTEQLQFWATLFQYDLPFIQSRSIKLHSIKCKSLLAHYRCPEHVPPAWRHSFNHCCVLPSSQHKHQAELKPQVVNHDWLFHSQYIFQNTMYKKASKQ